MRLTWLATFFSSSFLSSINQPADDEALTRFLQTSLFLVASPILVKSMFFSFRSSLTLSIQVFLCLPLLPFPSTCPCKAAFGSLYPYILSTCPNHCSLLWFGHVERMEGNIIEQHYRGLITFNVFTQTRNSITTHYMYIKLCGISFKEHNESNGESYRHSWK